MRVFALNQIPHIYQRGRRARTHRRHELIARSLEIKASRGRLRIFGKTECKVPPELRRSVVAAGPQDELRSGIDFEQAGEDEVGGVDFGDLLVVEAVGRVFAFVIVGEQFGGGEGVVGLLSEGAVGDVVLAGEGVGVGGVDPGDVEVVAYDVENGFRVVRL